MSRDFGPIHQFISDQYFEGNGWVYNGSAIINPDKNQIVYTCRARDMRCNGQSYVAIQRFELDWTPIGPPWLLPIITAESSSIDTGPQDARVFIFRRQTWIVFNMLCADGRRRMHLYPVTGQGNARVLTIDGDDRGPVEKNWTPFEFNGGLFFIYSFAPQLVILHCPNVDTGVCKLVYVGVGELPQDDVRGVLSYRGGSPAAQVAPNQFVGWLHTTGAPQKQYNPTQLPIPAQKSTPHQYRARRFTLTFGALDERPTVVIDAEHEFFGSQIEQVYGVVGDCLVVNVDDKHTVLFENAAT